jgi:ABC-type nickel/cobalt efflux system permease component RcnA
MEIFFLFVICVGGCWLVFKAIGEALFGKSEKDKYTFVDKSVHYHKHYTKEDHQHLHVIDEKTKSELIEYHEIKKVENKKTR